MTANEIRKEVSPMTIWMANSAIMEACISARKDEVSNPNPYNREGVGVAAEVLFSMFGTCSASIKNALLVVAESHKADLYYDSVMTDWKSEERILSELEDAKDKLTDFLYQLDDLENIEQAPVSACPA